VKIDQNMLSNKHNPSNHCLVHQVVLHTNKHGKKSYHKFVTSYASQTLHVQKTSGSETGLC